MSGRVRSLTTIGLSTVVLSGITILSISLVNISDSRASYTANELLPVTEQLDRSVSPTTAAKIGELLGVLRIPRLGRNIPVYEGTEPAQLRKGAGHYFKSVQPGVKDNSVIAGHRDSYFTEFGALKRGDFLIIDTPRGQFTYIITSFRIVQANDRSVIVPTKIATLTLSTCYPFHFIGSAPKRFIVTAHLDDEDRNI